MKKKLPIATPADLEGVTLMRMRSENIKCVRYIDVTLNETLTLIGSNGENDQGKTSFLDSYGWCLRGKLEIQMDPIRHGAQTGSITCDFGDGSKVKMSVTRTLKRVGDTEWTDSVDVEIPGFVAPSRIEEFLRRLTGDFVDPMAFDRLKPAERFEALQRLVSGFDFVAYVRNRAKLYLERTNTNRDQKREQSAADAIVISKEPPCEPVDEAALQEELLDAERRRGNRERAADTIRLAREQIARTDDAIAVAKAAAEATRDREIERLEQLIEDLRRQIANTKVTCDEAIARETTRLRADSDRAEEQIRDLEATLAAAPVIRESAEISSDLTKARTSNKLLADWQSQRERQAAYQGEADRLAQESDERTRQIDELDASRQKAIEEAKLPVDGIGFADGYVTLPAGDGSGPIPWEQAGTAVRTDASLALAMAMQPTLKVVLIRDGSLIGKTIRGRIRQRAAEKGYRVLMEVVEEGAGSHVVIENGAVRRSEGAAA